MNIPKLPHGRGSSVGITVKISGDLDPGGRSIAGTGCEGIKRTFPVPVISPPHSASRRRQNGVQDMGWGLSPLPWRPARRHTMTGQALLPQVNPRPSSRPHSIMQEYREECRSDFRSTLTSASSTARTVSSCSQLNVTDLLRPGAFTVVGKFLVLNYSQQEHDGVLRRAIPPPTQVAVNNAFRPIDYPVLSGPNPVGKLAYLYNDRSRTQQRQQRLSFAMVGESSRPDTRRSEECSSDRVMSSTQDPPADASTLRTPQRRLSIAPELQSCCAQDNIHMHREDD